MSSRPDADLWLRQAESDLRLLELIERHAETESGLYCQRIAKSQQAVEKSIKAIAAALGHSLQVGFPRDFEYRHDVSKVVDALRNKQFSWLRRLQQHLERHSLELKEVCGWAPSGVPRPGDVHRRNSEYPYETSLGVWTYPAASGAIDPKEVARARFVARSTFQIATMTLDSLSKYPNPRSTP